MTLAGSGPGGATYATLRRCPYHGGWIRLAECPIVATNEQMLEPQAPDAAAASLEEALGGTNGGGTATATAPIPIVIDLRAREDGAAGPQAFIPGTQLKSRVDGRERLVVAAPRAPDLNEQVRRRAARGAAQPLESPAARAAAYGGQRVRPVRACPDSRCLHPLPASIDLRDPVSIAVVGNARATKTTTVASLLRELQRHGPASLGVRSFVPSEATSNALRPAVRALQDGIPVDVTEGRRFHEPLEFTVELEGSDEAITVLMHDVAGETLMDANQRMKWAAHVLWSDVVLFLYNPEESPVLATLEADAEQAAVLTGVLADLELAPPTDVEGRPRWPRLVFAISKADLLPRPPKLGGAPVPEAEVVRELANLQEGNLVHAAERWRGGVCWRFVAPQPPSGEPQGVMSLFRRVLELAVP